MKLFGAQCSLCPPQKRAMKNHAEEEEDNRWQKTQMEDSPALCSILFL
jgi:hypothetical protein